VTAAVIVAVIAAATSLLAIFVSLFALIRAVECLIAEVEAILDRAEDQPPSGRPEDLIHAVEPSATPFRQHMGGDRV